MKRTYEELTHDVVMRDHWLEELRAENAALAAALVAKDAAMNRYQHVSPEAKARYTKMHRENFRCDYRAMIAVAEKEPQKVVQPDMVMVRKPRFWSKAESDAWHSALPDLHTAFDALAMAAEKE